MQNVYSLQSKPLITLRGVKHKVALYIQGLQVEKKTFRMLQLFRKYNKTRQ